jgi:hypothetical protein
MLDYLEFCEKYDLESCAIYVNYRDTYIEIENRKEVI